MLLIAFVSSQDGEAFKEAARAFIVRHLDRQIPSLFSSLKPLYRCELNSRYLVPCLPCCLLMHLGQLCLMTGRQMRAR